MSAVRSRRHAPPPDQSPEPWLTAQEDSIDLGNGQPLDSAAPNEMIIAATTFYHRPQPNPNPHPNVRKDPISHEGTPHSDSDKKTRANDTPLWGPAPGGVAGSCSIVVA